MFSTLDPKIAPVAVTVETVRQPAALFAEDSLQADCGRLGEFEQGNAVGGDAGEVEGAPCRVMEAMTSRRFPAPWTVIEHAESFWVQDAGGQTVGWFYFRTDPLVAKTAGVLLKDEARRMAVKLRPIAGPAWKG